MQLSPSWPRSRAGPSSLTIWLCWRPKWNDGVRFVPRRIHLLALLVLVAGSLLLSACQQPAPRKLHGVTDKMPQSDYPSAAARSPDLPLTDQYGRPFSLTTQQGKVVIVYFGYTSCPDVCPVTLAQLTQVWTGLGPEQARLFQPIFVTVDPERDTEEVIARYLSAFDSAVGGDQGLGFIGLRGMPEAAGPGDGSLRRESREKAATGIGGRLHGRSYGLYLRDRHRGEPGRVVPVRRFSGRHPLRMCDI